ncbi:MAG: hypothetical protein PGMFKBFP_02304 [Anaerolineales bacterium]|nr:hypothetical protein [Anaerolineales bacterium]
MLLVFLMVMVRTEGWVVRTVDGLKFLLMLTPGRLVREASVAKALETPLKVVTAPTGMRFVRFPLMSMTTRRVRVQVELAGRAPPL